MRRCRAPGVRPRSMISSRRTGRRVIGRSIIDWSAAMTPGRSTSSQPASGVRSRPEPSTRRRGRPWRKTSQFWGRRAAASARAVAAREGEHAAPEVRGIDHVDQHVGFGAPRRRVEVAERVGQRVLLARESVDEVAADHLAAVLHAQQRVAQRRPVAPRQLARDDAVARQEQLGARFVALLG